MASRAEETGALGATVRSGRTAAGGGLSGPVGGAGGGRGPLRSAGARDVDALAWTVLGDDPAQTIGALHGAVDRGATAEELARAVAYAPPCG